VAKSKYLSRKLLDHALGVQPYAVPAQVYLALFTSSAGLAEGSLANELAGAGYSRPAVHMAPAQDAATGAQSVGAQNIEFAPATADWPQMQAWAIMDADTGGNVLHHGALPQYGDPPAYKRVFTGDIYFIRAADIVISEE